MQSKHLRVLMVDASAPDADEIVSHLNASGYEIESRRVSDRAAMEHALSTSAWDVILCDYAVPSFDVPQALDLLRKRKLDLPFIVVSETAAESAAVEVMKAGAHDFVSKQDLARLVPAIDRELREAKVNTQRDSDLEKLFYLAAIVDSTGEAIFSHNLDGTITTWNAGAQQLFGFTEAETVGKSVSIIVPEELRPAMTEVCERLRQGKAVESFETRRARKDGVVLDVYLAISTIKGADGKLMGAASIAYDITERKKIEDDRKKMIDELNETLSKVRTLSGLLPICASCKKIRDDKGYWQKLETFVHEHSNAEFSHSICPDCMDKLYPDFSKRRE